MPKKKHSPAERYTMEMCLRNKWFIEEIDKDIPSAMYALKKVYEGKNRRVSTRITRKRDIWFWRALACNIRESGAKTATSFILGVLSVAKRKVTISHFTRKRALQDYRKSISVFSRYDAEYVYNRVAYFYANRNDLDKIVNLAICKDYPALDVVARYAASILFRRPDLGTQWEPIAKAYLAKHQGVAQALYDVFDTAPHILMPRIRDLGSFIIELLEPHGGPRDSTD